MATNNVDNFANPIAVGTGGSGQSTLTNHGVLIGASTSGITQLGAGTAGQAVRSGGASADPAYTTATYPSTAGTSTNVLTSDGTNWISSAAPGGGVLSASITLTSTQVKSLHSGVTLISAAGAGKTIVILSAISRYTYGGNNAFTGTANTLLVYAPISGPTNAVQTIISGTTQINGTVSYILEGTVLALNFAASKSDNQDIVIYNSGINYGGNAANDNTVTIDVTYVII
jgi:hypothetical protein